MKENLLTVTLVLEPATATVDPVGKVTARPNSINILFNNKK